MIRVHFREDRAQLLIQIAYGATLRVLNKRFHHRLYKANIDIRIQYIHSNPAVSIRMFQCVSMPICPCTNS